MDLRTTKTSTGHRHASGHAQRSGPKWHAAIWLLACASSLVLAQPRTSPEAGQIAPQTVADADRAAVLRGLQAQYQAALVRERRIADDRELKLMADAEAAMKRQRSALDQARGEVVETRRSLETARLEYARLVAEVAKRDTRVQAEIAAYQAEAQSLVNRASPEKLAALQRFADGDRVGAWPVIKDITEATRKARDAATAMANAADQRALARLRGIMRDNGEAAATEVLQLWDAAAALDGSDFETHVERGRLAQTIGDLERAAASFRQARASAESIRERSIVLEGLGEVLLGQGELAGARRSFEESVALRTQGLVAGDPRTVIGVHDLAVGMLKLGDVLLLQDDLDAAKRQYERSLTIYQRMASADPSSSVLQRDVAVSLQKLADLAVAQRDFANARPLFVRSLDILKRQLSSDGNSTKLQRDVVVCLSKLGSVLIALNDLSGAKQVLEQSLTILQRLAESDRSSALFERDSSVVLEKLGDLAMASKDRDGARRQFEKSLAIRQRLATADPSSATLQRDLLVSYWRLATFDNTALAWETVRQQLLGMQSRGQLRPADIRSLEEAQRGAQAATGR